MSTITTKDGTTIYYKDWGKGPVVTLSHGWPLNSDMWDGQMLFLAQHGFRVVAHDRRGHGRSSQAWSGNDMDGYADDLAAVIEALDLKDITMVGHSTGGGEVARYIGRYGTKRVAKAVLIAAVPPILLKSATNPEGLPIEVFDGLRSALAKDRSQAYKDFAPLFYGANRPGAQVSQGTLDQFWLWSMQAGLKNCVRQHQGLFGNRLHRRPQEVRRPDAGHARRGRSDRAGQGFGEEVSKADQGGRGNLLSGPAARPHRHACRHRQPRPARVLPAGQAEGRVDRHRAARVHAEASPPSPVRHDIVNESRR